ncbi:hypothetical protein DSS3P8_086 [Roseobacter phage DSS3P8]|nr:hypothetical protein DSS3P8_086 [Roseobacter phage DSS3P8]
MKYFLAIFALAIFGSAANAASIRMYTPGGSPCAGACEYEWAVDQFDVPTGDPQPMIIPAGSYVSQMSYAKDGVPYAMTDSAILAEDEPGIGYYFTSANGVRMMMVRLDVCQNWAVMAPPTTGPAINYTPTPTISGTPFTSLTPPTFVYLPPIFEYTPPTIPTGTPTITTPQPPVAPVPLGMSIVYMGLALAGLAFFKGNAINT